MRSNFTFILLFLPMVIFAQYVPLPENNATWEEAYVNFAGQLIPTFTTICGDTLIDGTLYSKVYGGNIENDQSASNIYYAGAIRQEGKQVWILYPNGNEELLYDFELQIGDTFSNTNMVVEYVTYTAVSGAARRTIVFESCQGLPNEYWIEGVGSSKGLLSRGACAIDYLPGANCLHEGGVLIHWFPENQWSNCTFDFSGLDCTLTPVYEPNSFEIIAYPSLFDDYFIVDISGESISQQFTISVWSALGQCVYTAENVSLPNKVAANSWPSGTYWVMVKAGNSPMQRFAVVKK